MQKSLVENLSQKLRDLDRGGYSRVYRKGGKFYESDVHMLVAEILDSLGASYQQNVEDPTIGLAADFVLPNMVILVAKELTQTQRNAILRSRKKYLIIAKTRTRSDKFDSGVRVAQLDELGGGLETIFLDDPSFSFDYAHILPHTEKCSVMHGHTSSALVEIIGVPRDGMVVNFNDAKPIIREAIRELDHKLFISQRYVTREDRRSVSLGFGTVHGKFELRVPRKTTVLLEGEATVENLAQEVLNRIAPRMPENVRAVGVYVYEGLNKGAYLLAELHRRDGGKRRKTR